MFTSARHCLIRVSLIGAKTFFHRNTDAKLTKDFFDGIHISKFRNAGTDPVPVMSEIRAKSNSQDLGRF